MCESKLCTTYQKHALKFREVIKNILLLQENFCKLKSHQSFAAELIKFNSLVGNVLLLHASKKVHSDNSREKIKMDNFSGDYLLTLLERSILRNISENVRRRLVITKIKMK